MLNPLKSEMYDATHNKSHTFENEKVFLKIKDPLRAIG